MTEDEEKAYVEQRQEAQATLIEASMERKRGQPIMRWENGLPVVRLRRRRRGPYKVHRWNGFARRS